MLEEATYQMEELERVNEELNNTIFKLREGKVGSKTVKTATQFEFYLPQLIYFLVLMSISND